MKAELFQLMFYPAETQHFPWNLMLGHTQFYGHCTLNAVLCPLTFDEARKLKGETVTQASSDAWLKARENRLTASCFHRTD